MGSPDDDLPTEDRCEVCGGRLADEIVIQEFADGSLARLCPECAAGAALDEHERHEVRPPSVVWPAEPADASAGGSAEFDPLEKTRELLMPVTDLIALQADMQSALERLASSLERFAAEMLTEAQGKTAVESRLQMLERELEKTRARLAETEFLLMNTLETPPGALRDVVDETAAAGTAVVDLRTATPAPAGAASLDAQDKAPEAAQQSEPVAPPFEDLWTLVKAREEEPAPEVEESPLAELEVGHQMAAVEAGTDSEAAPVAEAVGLSEAMPVAEVFQHAETTGAATTLAPEPAAQTVSSSQEETRGTGFRIDEVQAAQRYYNESPFVNRIRDVRDSLGRPKANLTRVPGAEPRAILTIAWDIVWYQYLIDLSRDLPSTRERVVLHREGMDLDELAYYFKEPNALVNDDGKLDASELEVRLLSDPSALITEMTQAEMQALEDATEEIWDQRAAPEFKWDD